MNPDGTPTQSTNKSAATRMQNTRKAAQRTQLQSQAAKATVKNFVQKPVPQNPVRNLAAEAPPVSPQDVKMPTGGPQAPPAAAQGFDPQVFHDNVLNEVVGKVRTQEFLNSAMVKDASTAVRVKNIFNNTNAQKINDPRMLLEQVMDRIGFEP